MNKKLKGKDNLAKEIEAKSAAIATLENKLESAQQGKECYRSKLNRCLKGSSVSQTAYDEIQCQLVAFKEECQLKTDSLESEVVELRSEVQTLRVEYEEMQSKIEDGKIETLVHSQLYTDNVRQCCLEFLRMNVGIQQVDPVIRSVLKNIAGMEVDKLPKPASLVRTLTELKCLSYQQIADELQGCENITLQKEKEELVQMIIRYGLWQSKHQIQEELLNLKSKKEKVTALKLQLDFRKKVLEQKHADKTLFSITKNKRQLTVEDISENLCQLLDSATTFPVASDSLAVNCESIIGKQIFHKWEDVDSKEKWYKGQVLRNN